MHPMDGIVGAFELPSVLFDSFAGLSQVALQAVMRSGQRLRKVPTLAVVVGTLGVIGFNFVRLVRLGDHD
jgi:hypothetical protein